MSGKWAGFLKNSKHLQTFEADLREHLATLFEVEDELIGFVLTSVTDVHDQKQLAAEFAETFEEDAAAVAAWCWEKLTQLSQQAEQPTDAAVGHADALEVTELQDGGSEEGELAAEQSHEAAHSEQEVPKKSNKREPIKFNLDTAAADTAPIKASSQKSQQLRPHRAANDTAAASAQQQPMQQQQQQQQRPEHPRGRNSRADGVRGAAAVVQGALQAAVRSAAAAADGKGTKDTPAAAAAAASTAAGPRGRGRSREQTPPVDAQQAAGSRPGRQDRQPDTICRAADPHRQPAARLSGSKRALADGAAGLGARGIASRALQQIGAVAAGSRTGRTAKRQQQQEQQQEQRSEAAERHLKQPGVRQEQQLEQQRRSRVSVLDRLGSRESQDGSEKASSKHSVFQRLSGLAPEAGAAQATATEHKQAAAAPVAAPPAAAGQPNAGQSSVVANNHKQHQERISQIPQQQQQQQQEAAEAKPQRKSVALRLEGAGSGLPEVQQQKQQLLHDQQEQQKQPPVGAEAATLGKGVPAQLAPAAASGTKRKPPPAVTGAAAVNGSASTAAAAAGNVAKKAATSTAAGSKPQQSLELAALRAKLAAKEAEVKRLQLQKAMQEADERSVVVFNVPPHVPEPVIRAHFGGCGPIMRCTLRGGPMGPTVPGAFIEFETTMGALAAMGLAGSFLLDQQIQVARKSDFQVNQQKAQQTFAAMRAQGARKAWVKPAAAPTPAAAANTAVPGEPESPTSLGSMGLLE